MQYQIAEEVTDGKQKFIEEVQKERTRIHDKIFGETFDRIEVAFMLPSRHRPGSKDLREWCEDNFRYFLEDGFVESYYLDAALYSSSEDIYYLAHVTPGVTWDQINTYQIETQYGMFQVTCDGELSNAVKILERFVSDDEAFLAGKDTADLRIVSANKIGEPEF